MSMRAWLVWFAVGAQVLLVALATFFEALLAGPSLGLGFVVSQITSAISILSFLAVGIIVFLQRPQHPIGLLFCVLNLGWSVNNFAGSYSRDGLSIGKGSLPAVDFVLGFYSGPGIISAGLLVLTVLIFPNGTLLSRRWRFVPWLVMGTVVAQTFAPGPIDPSLGVQANNPFGLEGPAGELATLIASVALPMLLLFFVPAAISMVLRMRRARGQERQQLKWFTSGFALETLLVVLSFVLMSAYDSPDAMPWWGQLVDSAAILGTALVPITAGIAVLKYRLYDIDLLINRTLVYGVLTGTLALFYWGSVVSLQALLRPIVGEGNDLAVVVSTLLIATLFLPLHRSIQGFIDRRFYGRKYDAARMLESFSATLRDEVDLDSLVGRLVEVVEETMQPAHGSLWLKEFRPDVTAKEG